jgi:hypothetical protein
MVLVAAMSLAMPGLAQDGSGVTVTLQYTDPATGQRTPVAGASFSVFDELGELVGADITDAEGVVLIPVPGRGVYTIDIDPASLPEGVALSNPDRTVGTVDVQEGETVRALFALIAGEGAAAGSTVTLSRVLQLAFDGLKEGLFLAMMAIGLSLIFGTTGLVNFAHAEMVTWGMLVAYFFNVIGLVGIFGFMEGWPAPFGGPVELIGATAIDPDRQGDAGRRRQPGPRRVLGHRRPEGDPVRLGGRRRARRPRRHLPRPVRAGQLLVQHGVPLLLLMFAGVILGGLGTAYGALVGSPRRRARHPGLDAVHPDGAEERRRPLRPDPDPARSAPRASSAEGEDRVVMPVRPRSTGAIITLTVSRRSTSRRWSSRWPPSASTSTSATPACSTSARSGSWPWAPTASASP